MFLKGENVFYKRNNLSVTRHQVQANGPTNTNSYYIMFSKKSCSVTRWSGYTWFSWAGYRCVAEVWQCASAGRTEWCRFQGSSMAKVVCQLLWAPQSWCSFDRIQSFLESSSTVLHPKSPLVLIKQHDWLLTKQPNHWLSFQQQNLLIIFNVTSSC